jgi:drug/metabolite transporter (DMT)-like permease
MTAIGNDAAHRSSGPGLVLAVVSAGSFGLSGALARGLLESGWTSGAIVLARMGIAALVVAPLAFAALRGRWRILRRNAGLAVFYGAVPMALGQFAYFSAVARMDVGPALLIEFMAPAAVVGWLWLRRNERPSRVTLAGAGVAALGLLLVLDLFSGADIAVLGVLWALVAMTGTASYYLIGADTTAEVPPLGLAGCSLAVGAVGLALLGATGLLPLRAAASAPDYGGTAIAWWVPILGLGIITAGVAYCAGIAAIRRLGSRVASFVGLLEVVAGVAFAWLLLDQVPGVVQVVGGGLVLTGVVLVKLGEQSAVRRLRPRRRTATSAAPPTPAPVSA